MSLTITKVFNPNTLKVDYFSEGQSKNPAVNSALVNLSRAGKKVYRLDNLQEHNDSSATWDGFGVHSDANRSAYEQRVANDITAAIKAATQPVKVVIAVCP